MIHCCVNAETASQTIVQHLNSIVCCQTLFTTTKESIDFLLLLLLNFQNADLPSHYLYPISHIVMLEQRYHDITPFDVHFYKMTLKKNTHRPYYIGYATGTCYFIICGVSLSHISNRSTISTVSSQPVLVSVEFHACSFFFSSKKQPVVQRLRVTMATFRPVCDYPPLS